jgi:hypothetical protein
MGNCHSDGHRTATRRRRRQPSYTISAFAVLAGSASEEGSVAWTPPPAGPRVRFAVSAWQGRGNRGADVRRSGGDAGPPAALMVEEDLLSCLREVDVQLGETPTEAHQAH